jgi:dihydrofolate synthase/folylpolyglutamate synthase
MFSRIGKAAYKADLENTHALMRMLDHPERGLKCVHIAGTNGKGSTSHMLASVLQEAGYRTGLYTSPHLKDFRERIRVNGAMIPRENVVAFVERYRSAFEPIAPSFFEWTVALAFDHFRSERTDIAVIETGLGGRLDSTNVVTPEVSVITNIGWDHADLLGGSLSSITQEKAGIIKTGVPAVIGEASGTLLHIFRSIAARTGSPMHVVDQSQPQPYPLDLAGEHQDRNARTVLSTIERLHDRGWDVPEAAVAKGLAKVCANTGFAGRWQLIAQQPRTIVDVGHNEDGLRVVQRMLDTTPHDHLHLVLGTVNDKDIGRMLAQLPKEAIYYFCKADIPRGLEANELAKQAAQAGLEGRVYDSVRGALAAARQQAGLDDLVLVTGSVFTVAEVL